MNWDFWVGGTRENPQPVLRVKHLVHIFGCRIDLHKMTGADLLGCYHSHPAHAIRLVLWGGYREYVYGDSRQRVWWPGRIGWITPAFCHRVHALLNGRYSYSLWIRFRVVAPINLVGFGWGLNKPDRVET